MNVCRRLFSTLNKLSALPKIRTINHRPVLSISLNQKAAFCSRSNDGDNKDEKPKLGLRRRNLEPYPHIDCVRELKLENYLLSSHKLVKYGEHEFLERFDGYVCVFISGYHHPRNLDTKSGYSVYFGPNHPLNLQGSVERRQSLKHAKLYAFLKAMEQIPKDSFKKLSIQMDELPLIRFIDQSLRSMSENSFRSVHTGKLNKDVQTSMEINKILRSRQDLTLQLMICPNDIGVDGMYRAVKMAEQAAATATADARKQKCYNLE
ncbi:ribonuclease H1-like [Contarinia nasturtii]|uniref:ribonuclease H1-like n=1 Tax=Contarinia nasturtii TaxID=265458 RepID=UPI0012D3D4F0|nr:ribonuclease H1-like [Contarinia nasturtii]